MTSIRRYLSSRSKDPTVWGVLAMMAVWPAAMVTGISPFIMIGVLGFGGAVAEWWTLMVWHRRRSALDESALLALAPPTDRWKAAVLILLAALVVVVELRLELVFDSPLWQWGLAALGISTVILSWYAWSRPVLVLEDGVVVGTGLVRWDAIESMEIERTAEAGALTFHFVTPHHVYATRLRVSASGEDLERIARLASVPARTADVLGSNVGSG